MKKIFSVITVAFMTVVMCLSNITAFAVDYPEGDYNDDGVFSSEDLRPMITNYAKIMISTNKGGTYDEWNTVTKIDEDTFNRLDISKDGKFNMLDITYYAEVYICQKTGYKGSISFENRLDMEDYAESIIKTYTGQDFSFKTMMNYIDSGMPTTEPSKPILIGDVNNDDKVDSKDAVVILQYYANSLAGVSQEELSLDVADLNNDKKIDSKDATLILISYANSLVK